MDQKKSGLGSGIGAYLVCEILYHAKISPHRKMKDFTDVEIKRLSHSIKYILKVHYLHTHSPYMDDRANDFLKTHAEKVQKGIFPDYHKDIKINKKDLNHVFAVYDQDEDPLGNPVTHETFIIANQKRTIHWVKKIQT